MYKINYVSNLVSKNKKEIFAIRFGKIFTLFVQIAIVVLIFKTIDLSDRIKVCNNNIDKIKTLISEKREKIYVNNIEKDWTTYYYKLKAVKQMLSNRTAYGLLLKNFAEVIPAENHVADIVVDSNSLKFDFEFTKDKKEKYSENLYQYLEEVKGLFENNSYFNKDKMEILNIKEQQKINDKMVDLLEIKIGCKTK